MDEQSYLSQLNAYDREIADYEQNLKRFRTEREEADEARRSVSRMRSDMDGFLSRRRAALQRLVRSNSATCFTSFLENAETLLYGAPYQRSQGRMDELEGTIRGDIRRLDGDIDFCTRELARLRAERESLYSAYQSMLAQQAAAQEAAAQQAAAQQAAAQQAAASQTTYNNHATRHKSTS